MTKIIKKVLMCQPDFFRIDYVINPWMRTGAVVNQNKALRQWEDVVRAYQKYNIEVEVIRQDLNLPDMVFSADQAFPFSKKRLVMSRFFYQQRQSETRYYRKWFEQNDFEIINLPSECSFEGTGNCLFSNGNCFLGNGFRNSQKTSRILSKTVGKKVLVLDIIDSRFYHIDTCLFILNPQTVFYYPRAFSRTSREIIKMYFKNSFVLEKEEALNFAANSVVCQNTIFTQEGNLRFFRELGKLGYDVVELDTSEFFKAGGGLHCLTLILE